MGIRSWETAMRCLFWTKYRARCKDTVHELSLREPAGFTRPCLISFRSFCIFPLFINFLNLSFSSYFFIFRNNLFKFSSSISLSSSLFLQKLFRNYFTFSRRSLHFSVFVPSQHTMSWGRPLMVLFWSKRPGP